MDKRQFHISFTFSYFILLMLTDGAISDMAMTKEAIVNVRLIQYYFIDDLVLILKQYPNLCK